MVMVCCGGGDAGNRGHDGKAGDSGTIEDARRAGPLSPADYAASVLEWRRHREEFFRTSPDSPVPKELRSAFPAPEYYAVEPSWRLSLPFLAYSDPETLDLITNTGERRALRRLGRVEFVRDGVRVQIHLYRADDKGQDTRSLWVPFTDSGAGRETYPAGRYVDAELQPDGTVLLDFNFAYNPYCAYGLSNYSCPMAPRENHLSIAIHAGERGYRH
jgi:hypothetical protein